MKWLIDDAADWWRWWSVRIQMVCAVLTGWLWFDPSSLLAVWNMMPLPLRQMLPDGFLRGFGVILFALSVASVFARATRQPKLDAKRKGAADGQ